MANDRKWQRKQDIVQPAGSRGDQVEANPKKAFCSCFRSAAPLRLRIAARAEGLTIRQSRQFHTPISNHDETYSPRRLGRFGRRLCPVPAGTFLYAEPRRRSFLLPPMRACSPVNYWLTAAFLCIFFAGLPLDRPQHGVRERARCPGPARIL